MRCALIPLRPHHSRFMNALEAGMRAIGDEVVEEDPDIVVVWGLRVQIPSAWQHLPRLILECGYVNGTSGNYHDDRLQYVSLHWNATHNHGAPIAGFDDLRWQKLGIELAPWKPDGHVALVLKQHPGDAVAAGADYPSIRRELLVCGYEVIEREHPLVGKAAPLEYDLMRADFAVTYCSTAAVEAVIAGVPTITLNDNSIAWPVTSHRIGDPLFRGDRLQWAHALAYRQWRIDELRSGEAWHYFREQMP